MRLMIGHSRVCSVLYLSGGLVVWMAFLSYIGERAGDGRWCMGAQHRAPRRSAGHRRASTDDAAR